MEKAIKHFRGNAVAYLALFVALGGTGYAAVSIPRNSVGTRQLKNGAVTGSKLGNGSVTQDKLDGHSIAGSVVFWAHINQNGTVVSSSEPAHTSGWSTGLGTIFFRGQLSNKCFALANVGSPPLTFGYVSTVSSASSAGQEQLGLFMSPAGTNQPGPLPVVVAEICP